MRLKRKPSPPEPRRRILGDVPSAQPSAAFSYHARRSDQESNTGRGLQRERLKKSTSRFGRFWLNRFGLAVLLIVVVAAMFNVLRVSTQVKIMPLNDNDKTFLRPQSVYAQAAAKLLGQSVWNSNKITIDTATISNELKAKFPELADVSIALPLIAHQPLVYVQAAQPALLLVAQNGSYIVGTSGVSLITAAAAPDASRLSLPVVTDHSGLTASVGRQALSSSSVSFIQAVVAELAAKGVTVSGMSLPPSSSELDVSVVGEPYFIKFNLANNDAVQQAGTYLAVRNQLTGQHITPAQYIDVRVDGRAYYK